MAVMIYAKLYTSFFDLVIQCIFCILSNPSTRIRMSAAVPFLRAVWKSARYSARLPHFDNMRQMRTRVISLYRNIDFINWYSDRKKNCIINSIDWWAFRSQYEFAQQFSMPDYSTRLKYLKVEVLLRGGASLKRVVTWSNEDGVLAYKSRERAFLPRNPSLTPHSCAATPLPLSSK